MSWSELLAKEILIRIPDDEVGFIYSVKCAGVTLRHGFVPALREEDMRARLFVRRSAAGNDERGARDHDA